MAKRITYYSPEGTIYSEIDDFEEDDYFLEDGDWSEPFPNEKGNSQAFGLVESLAQSENCPPRLMIEGVNRVTVETMSNKSID